MCERNQRVICRLHRLIHDYRQVVGQCLQLCPRAECLSKPSQRTRSVVLSAKEPPVNERLDASAQGAEKGDDDERGEDNDEWRLFLCSSSLPWMRRLITVWMPMTPPT